MSEPTRSIVKFLNAIGIDVREGALHHSTFLPGVEVVAGTLVYDESELTYPGDLLHEAGHLALMSPMLRHGAAGELKHPDPQSAEAAVIAWSYAAALHMGLDPGVVLHSGGYQGRSSALLQMYGLGVYPGVGALIEYGMTGSGDSEPKERFPAMLKWLRT